MHTDRNIAMVDKIEGYLNSNKEEVYFIVVGALHYPGEHGIVKLLQDKGYTLQIALCFLKRNNRNLPGNHLPQQSALLHIIPAVMDMNAGISSTQLQCLFQKQVA